MNRPEIILIAAMGTNRAIGLNNQLLWQIPEDMAYFKAQTTGHCVLMGRKTWESLPERFRPLPKRRNIVLSRQADYAPPGAECFPNLEIALKALSTVEKVYVIGGAEIYQQSLPCADTLLITEVDDAPTADRFFPAWPHDLWRQTRCEHITSQSGLNIAFSCYQRAT